MPKIRSIRPVLLSAPYGFPENNENRIHLRANLRTCGLAEITLDNGVVGIGEGYLPVFAPKVFASIVDLIGEYLVGRDAFDINARYRDMCSICDYWSMQGAARHAISAVELALHDAKGLSLNVPAYSLLGGAVTDSIQMYGSGGDSPSPEFMAKEIDSLGERGIRIFKIRSRKHEHAKAAWVISHADNAGVETAIDMTQNLANPAQSVSDIIRFFENIRKKVEPTLRFLEEPLGPMDRENWKILRREISCPVCGGETVTTAAELCERIRFGCYEFSQPDATVIGGMAQTMDVFTVSRQLGMDTVVHCWGAGVGMMGNYHTAFAGGGQLVEWPMPKFPLRERLMLEPLRIENGRLLKPTLPGLSVKLTPEIEKEFPFREEAVYRCLGSPIEYREEIWQ